MDGLIENLISGLSDPDDVAQQAAVSRARVLSSEGLQRLLDGYRLRRAQPVAQARPKATYQKALQWMHLVVDAFAPPQAETPELFHLSRGLTDVIAFIDDPTLIGPILLLLAGRLTSGADWELRNECCGALERLLPRLRPEDANGWTPEQRRTLILPLERICSYYRRVAMLEGRVAWNSFRIESLTPKYQPFYTLPPRLQAVHVQAQAVLKALLHIGDEGELPLLRELAEIRPHTAIGQEIQRLAVECVPLAEQRALLRRQARALLRPSIKNSNSDVLLRPASDTRDDASSQELLRSHQQENVRTDLS